MHIVSFDIGATNTRIAVLDLEGRIIERREERTKPTPNEAMPFFRQTLGGFYNNPDYHITYVAGGAPAVVGGIGNGYFIDKPSNMPGWANFRLRESIDSIVADIIRKIPGSGHPFVIVENDANAGAVGAAITKNNARGNFPLLYCAIGTGFGGKMVFWDKTEFELYRDPDGKNMELGHQRFSGRAVNMEQINCGHCPYPDCAETLLGGKFMKKRYGFNAEEMPFFAQEMVADNLTNFLSRAKLLFNPATIVLGGGVANGWGSHFVDRVNFYFSDYCRQQNKPQPRTELSQLGADTNLIGAWAVAIKTLTGHWPYFDLKKYLENQAVLYKN